MDRENQNWDFIVAELHPIQIWYAYGPPREDPVSKNNLVVGVFSEPITVKVTQSARAVLMALGFKLECTRFCFYFRVFSLFTVQAPRCGPRGEGTPRSPAASARGSAGVSPALDNPHSK
jgi:hypothetical protein